MLMLPNKHGTTGLMNQPNGNATSAFHQLRSATQGLACTALRPYIVAGGTQNAPWSMRVMTCPPSMSAAMARQSHFGGFIRFTHAREPAAHSLHDRPIYRHVQDGAAPELLVTTAAPAQIARVACCIRRSV